MFLTLRSLVVSLDLWDSEVAIFGAAVLWGGGPPRTGLEDTTAEFEHLKGCYIQKKGRTCSL